MLRVLDRLRTDRRYGNRSELVRDLLRAELVNHLEAIPLRGSARAIRQVANRLLSIEGVRHGHLVPATGKRVM